MARKIFALLCPLFLLLASSCSLSPDQLQSAEKLMQSHPDSALHILQSIRTIQLISPADKALYSLLLSQAYDRNDIYIASDSIISVATHYYGKNSPEKAGASWLYYARCAKTRGNAEVQASALLKAQEFAEISTDYKLRALIYCDKADMYKAQNQLDSSIVLNKKGLQAFSRANDTYNVCLTAVSIGLQYSANNQPDSCMQYLRFAEKMGIAHQYNDLLSPAYKGMGNCMLKTKDYRKALGYYRKAPITGIALYDENISYLLSNNYLLLNKPDSAEYYIRQVHNAANKNVSYYELRKNIAAKKQNKAEELQYANELITAKDSFYTRNLKTSFAGLETRFKYDKLSEQNDRLKIENTRKATYILIILLIVSLLITAAMYRMLRLRKAQLATQRQLNEKEKDLLIKATENNSLLERQLEIERQLNESEKKLLQHANENNRLLQLQNDMQQQLLLFIEQYRLGAGKGNIDIQAHINDEDIKKQIILYVDSKYNNISQRLYREHLELQLTERDVYVCCMLLAGFTSGMIAFILGLQLNSVNMLRGRLRKKLKIENNEKLTEALSKL